MPLRFLLAGLLAAAVACAGPAAGGKDGVPAWPDTLPASAAFGAPRGYRPLRAILHVHSLWSHDACDRDPWGEAGEPNEACLARFRAALCAARVDAAFLTEHDRWLAGVDSLAAALLLRPGDRPVMAEGHLVASRIACPGGRAGPLLFPGAENRLAPIALDSLPRGTLEAKRAFYERRDSTAVETFHDWGAIVLLTHPEDLPLDTILGHVPDAIEVVNPHAMFAPKHRETQGLSRLGGFVKLLPFVLRTTNAHPDLALLPLFEPNRAAIDRWDALLARRMVHGYGASDAHENALPITLADGLRGDAYARLIPWITNVLLTRGGDDPQSVEEAVRSGRLYVALEAWGTPAGFDFRVDGPAGSVEMGAAARLGAGMRLVVEPPRLAAGAGLPAPEIRSRVYRIDARGARTIVAEGPGRIDLPLRLPGAYRVEVGIVPRHLAPYLGRSARRWMREVPWVYSNPIRIEP